MGPCFVVPRLIIDPVPLLRPSHSKQQWILDNMAEVFRTVQREHQLPVGDFPNIEHFKNCIKDYDFSKFPKLDLACVKKGEGVEVSCCCSH